MHQNRARHAGVQGQVRDHVHAAARHVLDHAGSTHSPTEQAESRLVVGLTIDGGVLGIVGHRLPSSRICTSTPWRYVQDTPAAICTEART